MRSFVSATDTINFEQHESFGKAASFVKVRILGCVPSLEKQFSGIVVQGLSYLGTAIYSTIEATDGTHCQAKLFPGILGGLKLCE